MTCPLCPAYAYLPPHPDPLQDLRLSLGELAIIRGKARAAGLPVSAYLRQVGLGKKVRARRGQIRRDATYLLIRIGTNINQLARAANTAGQVVALDLLEEAIEELRGRSTGWTGEGRR